MRQIVVTLTLLLAAGLAGAQSVYRCTGPNGQPSFQQTPCDATRGEQGGAIAVRQANVLEVAPDVQRRLERNASGAKTEEDMLRELGRPVATNTTVVGGEVRRQHVYRNADGSTRYVYTRNGEVYAAQHFEGTHRPAAQPCYSAREIANARTSATSVTIPADQREALQRRVAQMEDCRR